jgi:hypothetical protein
MPAFDVLSVPMHAMPLPCCSIPFVQAADVRANLPVEVAQYGSELLRHHARKLTQDEREFYDPLPWLQQLQAFAYTLAIARSRL